MIVARLMGGLGNQMFQFAAARRLALRHGVELRLDLGWFSKESHLAAMPRTFELSRFGLGTSSACIAPGTVAAWEQGRRAPFRQLVSIRALPPWLQVIRQRELDFAVDQPVLEAPDGCLLVAYWQSEAYFADIATTIKRNFRLPVSERPSSDLADAIRTASVAMHVRRGDYVSDSQTSQFHGVLPTDYYVAAFDLIRSRPSIRTCMCSPKTWSGPARPFWLGGRPGSVIVAPMRWFADPSIDTSSIVPERWMRL